MKANPLIRGAVAAAMLVAYWGVAHTESRPVSPFAPEKNGRSEQQELAAKSEELYRLHRYSEALPLFRKLHEEFPDNHIYLFRLATMYQSLGRTGEEVAAWEKYMDVAPNPEEACPEVGEAWHKLGRQAQSIRAFERCVAVSDSSDAIFYLARAYERAGDWPRARAMYQRGIDQSPEYTDLRVGLGRVQYRMDDTADAKANVDRVLAKSPQNSDALLLAGMIAKSAGDLPAAKQYLATGAAVSPNYTDIHRLLGRVAEELNDRETALRAWQRVLTLTPGDPVAERAVRRLSGVP